MFENLEKVYNNLKQCNFKKIVCDKDLKVLSEMLNECKPVTDYEVGFRTGILNVFNSLMKDYNDDEFININENENKSKDDKDFSNYLPITMAYQSDNILNKIGNKYVLLLESKYIVHHFDIDKRVKIQYSEKKRHIFVNLIQTNCIGNKIIFPRNILDEVLIQQKNTIPASSFNINDINDLNLQTILNERLKLLKQEAKNEAKLNK